jgi:phage/plasmid-like protein (TIGR03299 family)
MTTETISHLNTQVLIGFTDQRGTAWHYKKDEQGAEPNHYPAAIPVADVQRRLFSWQAKAVEMWVDVPKHLHGTLGSMTHVPNRQAIVRDDTYQVLGVLSKAYVPHQYDEWLLKQVANLLDDDLAIGSAGLLKGGAVAWVQVEMPETWKVAGVEFRPHLMATTSLNGEIATLYKRTCTIVVCDNTRAQALRETGQEFRVKHTSQSLLRLSDARDALSIVHTIGDDFAAEIEALMARRVTDRQFDRFLSLVAPADDTESRQAQSRAENQRNTMRQMWQTDIRCAPFRGTAFGAVQTVNTWRQHIKPTRAGRSRFERTMLDTMTGITEASDRKVCDMIMAVTA